MSFHGPHEAELAARLVERIVERGERLVCVTDAGMPGISDPGERLVTAALAAGVAVEVVPGPSAGAGRPGAVGAAHRPVRLRGLPAPEGAPAGRAAGRARGRGAHGGAVRSAPPPGGHPGRPGRGPRGRPAGGGGPGDHEEVRDGVAGDARAGGRRATAREARGEQVIVLGPGAARPAGGARTTKRSKRPYGPSWPAGRRPGMRRRWWRTASASPADAPTPSPPPSEAARP